MAAHIEQGEPGSLVGTSLGGSVLRAALRISVVSLAWTLAVGTWAIALGATSDGLSLGSFGAIGLLDAVGSATLVVHFGHALRHEAMSERREHVARRVVTLGMACVGLGTLSISIARLLSHGTAHSSEAGVALAGASMVVLGVLARGKLVIARGVPSRALRADGWVSAIGAVLAGVTLAGTALTSTFGWSWIDPVAAIGIGGCAVGLSVRLAAADPD